MVRIQLSPAAFAAIAGDIQAENKRADNGDYFVWLDHSTLSKFNHLRGPGESYSDVILRVAAEATERR
jgi:hypothetical protein